MSTLQGSDSAEVLERFNQHLTLVDIVARQVKRGSGVHAEFSDLQSFARSGLLNAARRYDPARGVPFAAYARLRMRGAVIDGLRATASLPRRVHERLRGLEAAQRYSEGLEEDVLSGPRNTSAADAERALNEHLAGMATAMALGLISPTVPQGEAEREAVAGSPDPEALLARAELVARVQAAIAELTEQEATLVRRHYLEGERFDQVAADLGLSKSWGSRLHTRALQRLSKKLRGVTDDL
jgi:RNA polymerase sigma factor for flagellar operon FliA